MRPQNTARKVLVNVDLIKEQVQNNTLNSFAFFVKAKLLFANSTIFRENTSTRKMAAMFGCSHVVIKKYLGELREQNLLRELAGNITFVSLKDTDNKCKKDNSTKIWITATDSISTIATKLKFAVLQKNIQNQKFIQSLKADIIKHKRVEKKHYKKYFAPLSEKQRQLNDDLVMSNNNLAKQLNCTAQQISYLKNKWSKLNLARFYRVWKPLGKVNRKHFENNKQFFGNYSFVNKNGYAYQFLHTKVELAGEYKAKSKLGDALSN